MRTKMPFFMLIMLLLLSGGFYLNHKPSKKNVITTLSENKSKSRVKIELPTSNQPEATKQKEPLDLLSKDEINGIPISEYLAEISSPVYSDDPVLEIVSLSMDFRVCKHPMQRLLKKAENHPQLKSLVKDVESNCQAFAEQYPLWFNVKDREQSAMSLPTTSLFGEQYKFILAGYYDKHRELDFDQLNAARLELSLQIKSPTLVSFGALDSGIGIIAPLEKTAFFKDLLHSEVGIWVYQSHELALQSWSCKLPNSRSCEATSFYMLNKCNNETAACGLNFQQWYDFYITPGMKQDMAIVLQYYRDNY